MCMSFSAPKRSHRRIHEPLASIQEMSRTEIQNL